MVIATSEQGTVVKYQRGTYVECFHPDPDCSYIPPYYTVRDGNPSKVKETQVLGKFPKTWAYIVEMS